MHAATTTQPGNTPNTQPATPYIYNNRNHPGAVPAALPEQPFKTPEKNFLKKFKKTLDIMDIMCYNTQC